MWAFIVCIFLEIVKWWANRVALDNKTSAIIWFFLETVWILFTGQWAFCIWFIYLSGILVLRKNTMSVSLKWIYIYIYEEKKQSMESFKFTRLSENIPNNLNIRFVWTDHIYIKWVIISVVIVIIIIMIHSGTIVQKSEETVCWIVDCLGLGRPSPQWADCGNHQ